MRIQQFNNFRQQFGASAREISSGANSSPLRAQQGSAINQNATPQGAIQRLIRNPSAISDISRDPRILELLETRRTQVAGLQNMTPEVSGKFAPRFPAQSQNAVSNYLTRTPASIPQAWGLPFTSKPLGEADLLDNVKDKDYIVASLPTPPEIKQMRDAGVANIYNEPWQQAVTSFAEKNGGLGTPEDGFLAFSENYGFVRLRNTNLSPEQNQKLAMISLQTGTPIEVLPTREFKKSVDDPELNRWVNEVIGKFETAIAQFEQNPTEGVSVKDGRREFSLIQDPESGYVASTYVKHRGGIAGIIEKNLPGLMKTVGAASSILSIVAAPVLGPLAGLISTAGNAINAGLASTVTGKFDWKGVAGSAIGALGSWVSGGLSTVSETLGSIVNHASNIGGKLLSGVKLKFKDFASAALDTVPGLNTFSLDLADGLRENILGLPERVAEKGFEELSNYEQSSQVWKSLGNDGLDILKDLFGIKSDEKKTEVTVDDLTIDENLFKEFSSYKPLSDEVIQAARYKNL